VPTWTSNGGSPDSEANSGDDGFGRICDKTLFTSHLACWIRAGVDLEPRGRRKPLHLFVPLIRQLGRENISDVIKPDASVSPNVGRPKASTGP
jgi:hypothetical protein